MDVPTQNLEHFLARFGLSQFRPGQRQVIDAILEGRDCLCIMPTGGGKSLCFQLPAVARSGTVIVVSPLIALMKDQVDSLTAQNISATLINSSLTLDEQNHRIQKMRSGAYDLVYVAPERIRSRAFVNALADVDVQLLAVDEAHCISQWGHDFRPDYARLGRMRKHLGWPQTVALTATATQTVRDDVCQVLELDQPAIFVSGFARDNLSLASLCANTNSEKDRRLVEFLDRHDGCGIVYSATRKGCEHIVDLLSAKVSRSIDFYHAGLEPEQRKSIQSSFSIGETEIIVATNAFGMGIDKSDLRFVVHYNLPGSIEAYYQEAGRAGRDGKPSDCLLLHSYQDRFLQEFFIENSYPSRAIVKRVYQYLCGLPDDPIEMTLVDIQQALGLSIGSEGIRVCETLLEKCGAIERLDTQLNQASVRISHSASILVDLLPRESRAQRKVLQAIEKIIGDIRNERVYFSPQNFANQLNMKWDSIARSLRELGKLEWFDYVPPFRGRAIHMLRKETFDNLAIDFDELEKRKQSELDRLENVVQLASTQRCRQFAILEYFGDTERSTCGKCDNCSSDSAPFRSEADIARSNGSIYAVQVALSGAARTKGRVGKTLLAQMLCGSEAKKIKQLGLQRVSTFGKLGSLSQSETVELIDALIAAQLIKQSEPQKFRPVVEINQRGLGVMKGSGSFDFLNMIPNRLAKKLNFEFGDKRPVGMESSRPPEVEDVDPPPVVSQAAPSQERTDSGHAEPKRPSHYWTWLLIQKGFSIEEVCQIRRLTSDVVEDHMRTARDDMLCGNP